MLYINIHFSLLIYGESMKQEHIKNIQKKIVLLQWLKKHKYLHMMQRVFKGIQTNIATTKFSFSSEHKNNQYQSLIHLSSYNYAGLSGHPKIIASAKDALDNYGTSTSGVRLLNGTYDLHLMLEQKLANFLDTEAVVTYSSGYVANISVLSTLCDEGDVVFSDQFNHQSIIDGLRLSRAKVITFPHLDYEKLEALLAEYSSKHQTFIVSDGVFSMDGDIADLPKIVALSKKYDSITIIDDAHGTAALGPQGQGSKHHFSIKEGIDVITGSLSKGLPGIGGFAACSETIADSLRFGSGGYIFSASLTPATVAGLIMAIDILENEPERQIKLQENTKMLKQGLQSIGLNTMQSTTAVIPILMPSREKAWQLSEWLHEHGVFINAISFPAVPLDSPRLRLNASTAFEKEDIAQALNLIEEAAKHFQLI
jgi:glycine C-acetyltransferase